MADEPVVPRPASTLIVVRAGADAPEILLMKRHARSRFMPDAYVFAGGSLDAADAGERMYGLCANLQDARASEILGVPRDGLQFFVAAVRECFEECGILFAYDCGDRNSSALARGKFINCSTARGTACRPARSRSALCGTRLASGGGPADLLQPLDYPHRTPAALRHAIFYRRCPGRAGGIPCRRGDVGFGVAGRRART